MSASRAAAAAHRYASVLARRAGCNAIAAARRRATTFVPLALWLRRPWPRGAPTAHADHDWNDSADERRHGPLEPAPYLPNNLCAQDSNEEQFSVHDPWQACFRVLWRNPAATAAADAARAGSVLGRTGHLERANAWTHVVGTVLFALFCFVRAGLPGAFDQTSIAGQLSALSARQRRHLRGVDRLPRLHERAQPQPRLPAARPLRSTASR